MIPKIANEPFQLQQDVKPRAGVELLPAKIVPDDENILSHEQEGDDRNLPEEVPDDEEMSSHERKHDDTITLQEMSDDENIPSEPEKG